MLLCMNYYILTFRALALNMINIFLLLSIFRMMEHGLLSPERSKKAFEKKQRRQKEIRSGIPMKPSKPLSRPESSQKKPLQKPQPKPQQQQKPQQKPQQQQLVSKKRVKSDDDTDDDDEDDDFILSPKRRKF
uniref:Uncharacterized protein n=1 Tax=Cannabis sativa TaxID=3483 RepID=A0A803QTB0_CANSA